MAFDIIVKYDSGDIPSFEGVTRKITPNGIIRMYNVIVYKRDIHFYAETIEKAWTYINSFLNTYYLEGKPNFSNIGGVIECSISLEKKEIGT